MRCALGRVRGVDVTGVSFVHSYCIRTPQRPKITEAAEWLQSLVRQGRVHTRPIHHSAELHGFYTNRLYKKRCGRCGRPNIVPVTRCGYCDEALTDEDIRAVGRDVLKELAASRVHHHSQVNVDSESADVPTSVPSGPSSERTETGKFRGRLRLAWCREPGAPVAGNLNYSHAGRSCQPQRSDEQSTTRNIVWPGTLPKSQQPSTIEYYRSFDFLITQYAFPIAAVHLSAVVKGTVYDVKQLRPSHVPLLHRMQRQTVAVVEDILQANLSQRTDEVLLDSGIACRYVNDECAPDEKRARGGNRQFPGGNSEGAISDKDSTGSVAGSESSRRGHPQRWRTTEDAQEASTGFTYKSPQKQSATLTEVIRKLKSCVIFGFTYPCEYNQVNMHAIVPPILNFNMMKAPFFLPLKKVLLDLRQSGYVQVNERDAGSTPLGRDAILEEVRLVDSSIRRLLVSRACVLRKLKEAVPGAKPTREPRTRL